MSFSALSGRLLRASRCLPKLPVQARTLSAKPTLSTPSSFAATHRAAFRSFSATSFPRTAAIPRAANTLGGLADSITAGPIKAAAKSAWPEVSDKVVGHWLIGSGLLVFGIVILGGLTRLTESGLSITEWKPVTGSLPPLSLADWMENFNKYKDSPEYRIINPNMTLDEYKFIYYMEWAHRLWGRAIGISFVLPAVYFVARRRVTPKVAFRLLGISSLIGFQGFIGWWMVKSGLRDDLFAEPGANPRVSQYRLTAHLGAAFVLYSAMIWNGIDILRTNRLLKDPAVAVAAARSLSAPQLRVFRALVGVIVAMVFTTAMSGGLVAGLDAGLIYNEFPKMGNGYMPPTSEMMDPFYSHTEDGSDLWWRNMLENPTTVQFQHRCAAMSTFSAILALFLYSRLGPKVKGALPADVRKGTAGVMHLAILQALLGIGTLIYMVPTHMAATHQAGALALLTGAVVLGHRVTVPRLAAGVAARRIEALRVAGGRRV